MTFSIGYLHQKTSGLGSFGDETYRRTNGPSITRLFHALQAKNENKWVHDTLVKYVTQ
jgi:hypothetical protein